MIPQTFSPYFDPNGINLGNWRGRNLSDLTSQRLPRQQLTIFEHGWIPSYHEKRVPAGRKREGIELTPSSIFEDWERATNMLKVSIADLYIAIQVYEGHGDDYFPGEILPMLQWKSPTPYSYLQWFSLNSLCPNLLAAAEKIFHEARLDWKNPWIINIEHLLMNDFGFSHFRQSRHPALGFQLYGPSLCDLRGEQDGILEQFSVYMGSGETGERVFSVPIRRVYDDFFAVAKVSPLPWVKYPLYGLNRLHHEGIGMVCLTPSMYEAMLNGDNPNVVCVSWLGGVNTIEQVDFEPLKGFSVIYLFNPKIFSDMQEATNCFEAVQKRLNELEIGFRTATMEVQ